MEEKHITTEEHKAMRRAEIIRRHKRKDKIYKIMTWSVAVAAIIALVGGFYGGMAYQKHKDASVIAAAKTSGPATAISGQQTLGSGPCIQAQTSGSTQQTCGTTAITGQVKVISATSITEQTAGGTLQTYAITSTTTIQDNGQSVTYADITIGDTVQIIPSTTISGQAAGIIVNPKTTTSGSATITE